MFKYSGTAKAMPGITHNVRVEVFDSEEDLLVATDSMVISSDSLAFERTCEVGNLVPGKYELSVYLDWNDDGIRNSFEPSASLGRIPFEILDKKVNLEVSLGDKSLPYTGGWIEGAAIFEALEGNEGKHNFLLEITHTDEGFVKEYTSYVTGLQLKNGLTYGAGRLFPGGPYSLKAVWGGPQS